VRRIAASSSTRSTSGAAPPSTTFHDLAIAADAVGGVSQHAVPSGSAGDPVDLIVADADPVVPAARDDEVLACTADEPIAPGAAEERVVPWAADETVPAGVAEQRVRAGAADEHVVARAPADAIAPAAADEAVVARGAGDLLRPCNGRGGDEDEGGQEGDEAAHVLRMPKHGRERAARSHGLLTVREESLRAASRRTRRG
jgi:hypothetical protein